MGKSDLVQKVGGPIHCWSLRGFIPGLFFNSRESGINFFHSRESRESGMVTGMANFSSPT
jgi:hypothetical protein